MIHCIWYPSGGFGHFVNAVLSLHGNNFVRPSNTIEFSSNGNSHSLELVAPKYSKNQNYDFNFLPDVNYSVLVDNGINDEGEKFKSVFDGANIIKLCYTDYSWPVVAKTMIEKAMESSIESELDFTKWHTDENWARREKYFLFLRDHPLRYKWRHSADTANINIETLLEYAEFKDALIKSGIGIESFRQLWEEWLQNNFKYFLPILAAQDIIKQVKNKQSVEVDLSMVTDVWVQAVIYYYIWLEFNVEVPHNDYANFFTNTKEIATWLKL